MSTWPEEWEGGMLELGRERTEMLLSLDDDGHAHRDIIRALAHHLWSAVLVGEPAPAVRRMYQRISKPQPGDLVVETSTFRREDPEYRHKGLGYLLAERVEWACTLEELEASHFMEICYWENSSSSWRGSRPEPQDPADRGTDHAWYVQYGQAAGDICRWTNCSFIVVPDAMRFFDEPHRGTVEPGGAVTLTRDDLIGSLADSGFRLRPGI